MIKVIYILYRLFLYRKAECSPLWEPTCGKRPTLFFKVYDKTSAATYNN